MRNKDSQMGVTMHGNMIENVGNSPTKSSRALIQPAFEIIKTGDSIVKPVQNFGKAGLWVTHGNIPVTDPVRPEHENRESVAL